MVRRRRGCVEDIGGTEVKSVFVDTSGFYAILDGTDPLHARCTDAFRRSEKEGSPLVTTNYVVHETWALLQARLGWEAVEAWRARVLPLCETVWVDERLHSLGAARCSQARERRLSLTDGISIEVMRGRGLRAFIGQDEHLAREGFEAS
jgi:predicted nucleic acid-binding protein